MVSNRNGQRHIDSDHADLDVVSKVARGFAVSREDAGAVAVLVIVDELHRLFFGFSAHHAQYRAEDLFLVDTHARRHVVEQAGTEKEAILVASNDEVANPVYEAS